MRSGLFQQEAIVVLESEPTHVTSLLSHPGDGAQSP